MKKIIVAIALVAAACFASFYNVEIKVSPSEARAECDAGNPNCF